MASSKCPFSVIQAAGLASCKHAEEVVRRGGSEFDCTDPESKGQCETVLAVTQAQALDALGHVDDLTQTPHSVYEKIMLGTVLGLSEKYSGIATTENIGQTLAVLKQKDVQPNDIPIDDYLPAIKACKLRRRKK